MKKLFLLLTVIAFSLSVFSQGKSGDKSKSKNKTVIKKSDDGNKDDEHGNSQNDKEKSKEKNKEKADDKKKQNDEHEQKIWDGVDGGNSCGKISKNQPAKVRSSFQRDYPNANNVRWTKCRGDWTARFQNGLFLNTAIYHANGDRKDTRSLVTKDKIPRNIIDDIFKKKPDSKIDDAIKIEIPKSVKDIFRIKNMIEGKPVYTYYDADGKQVNYDY